MVLDTKQAPVISLDDKFYKLVDKMDSLTLAAPSLKEAKSLTVKGPVKFDKGVVIKGDVLVVNGMASQSSISQIYAGLEEKVLWKVKLVTEFPP